jgi:hypothetical protein
MNFESDVAAKGDELLTLADELITILPTNVWPLVQTYSALFASYQLDRVAIEEMRDGRMTLGYSLIEKGRALV